LVKITIKRRAKSDLVIENENGREWLEMEQGREIRKREKETAREINWS